MRASLSLEAVIAAAVALLDAHGEAGLTFRALAAHLGGGVGSIYWYVDGKDQLLELATDSIIGEVLADLAADDDSGAPAIAPTGPGASSPPDPDVALARVRRIALSFFSRLERHPWMASYLLRTDSANQTNALRFWDLIGRQLRAIGLSPAQQFNGVTTVVNYVAGIGAQLTLQAPPLNPDGTFPDREAFLAERADEWLTLDPDEFPFVHAVAPLFRTHDDDEQFAAGLDLILLGLRVQARGD